MEKRKKLITVLVTGALAVVAVFGAFTYRAVYAQSATPTPAAPGSTTNNNQALPGQPGPGKGGRGGMRGGYTDQELATALGITTDQLQAAYTKANTEALKEAVSKGLITQAQSDQLSANGFDQHRLGMLGGPNGIDYNAILANALGITADKLKAAEQQAYNANIDAAVQSGAITQAQADEMKGMNALKNDTKFQAAMKSAYEAAVKQAVTDGVITQAQADAILSRQSQTGGFGIPGFDFGPGHGFGRGHGGPGFNGAPGSNQNNPAPTTVPSTNGL